MRALSSSNFFLALSAFALHNLSANILYQKPLGFSLDSLIAGMAVWASYLFTYMSTGAKASGRYQSASPYLKLHRVLFYAVSVTLLSMLWYNDWKNICLFICLALCFAFYSLPVLNQKPLRQVGWLKPYWVSIAWWLFCVYSEVLFMPFNWAWHAYLLSLFMGSAFMADKRDEDLDVSLQLFTYWHKCSNQVYWLVMTGLCGAACCSVYALGLNFGIALTLLCPFLLYFLQPLIKINVSGSASFQMLSDFALGGLTWVFFFFAK